MPKTDTAPYIIHYQFEWEYDESPRLLVHQLYTDEDGYLMVETDTILDRYDFTDEDIWELLSTHDLKDLGDFYTDEFLSPENLLTLGLPANAHAWVEALLKGIEVNA